MVKSEVISNDGAEDAQTEDMQDRTVKSKTAPRYIKLRDASPELEALHKKFIDHVFTEKIKSVETVETKQTRSILFAGTRTISANKKTGLITYIPFKIRRHAKLGDFNDRRSFGAANHANSFQLLNTKVVVCCYLIQAWKAAFTSFYCSSDAALDLKITHEDENYSRYPVHDLNQVSSDIGSRIVRGCNNPAVGYFFKYLWEFLLDKEIARMAIAYFGNEATLTDYNFVISNKLALTKLLEETPNLSPLIGCYLSTETILDKVTNGDTSGVIASIKQILIQQEQGCSIKAPGFGIEQKPVSVTPLSQAGWRLLSHSSVSSVRLVIGSKKNGERGLRNKAPDILNTLAVTGSNPTYSLLKRLVSSLLNDFYAASPEETTHLTRFFRLAADASQKAKKSKRLLFFIQQEYSLVWDYFRRSNPSGWVPILKNATWNSLMRQQREWHDAIRIEAARAEAAAAESQIAAQAAQDALRWPCSIDTQVIDDFEFTPLTSGFALREEGATMQHCVATYTPDCVRRQIMIFKMQSLKTPSDRATLEISHQPIRVAQIRGVRNAMVSTKAMKTAKDFAALYKKSMTGKSQPPKQARK